MSLSQAFAYFVALVVIPVAGTIACALVALFFWFALRDLNE